MIDNVLYGISIIIAVLIILYALQIHFMSFRSKYYLEIANVIEVDCNRFPVNNHRSEYHCVVGIEYPARSGARDEKITNSLTFVDSEKFYKGDLIEILVNKENPLDIIVKVVSDQTWAIMMMCCAIISIIITTGMRFMKIASHKNTKSAYDSF